MVVRLVGEVGEVGEVDEVSKLAHRMKDTRSSSVADGIEKNAERNR